MCEGYTPFLNNRKERHREAPKPSGGVAILVRDDVLQKFDINIIDKAYDGILAIKCKHKETDFTAILFACYLPPQNSPWGRDAQPFFAHLISEIYLHSYADFIICGGDINARIGNIEITDPNLDMDIPKRISIDLIKSGHYVEFIDFLRDSKFFVLNGSITPDYDNFTNTKRGKSVVDYMFVPHDNLSNIKSFSVDLANSLIDDTKIHHMIGERCKVPDHSLLTTRVNWGIDMENNRQNDQYDQATFTKDKRYAFKNLIPESLNNPIWQQAILNIIERLIHAQNTQQELDALYIEFCKSLFSELDDCLGFKYITKKHRKRLRNNKPYWNENLFNLWKEMVKCEKMFSKYKGNSRDVRNMLYQQHISSQATFDRELRAASRKYNKEKVNEIEKVCTDDHKAFWEKIKSLGPRKDNKIPLKVKTSQGLATDRETVLNKWETDFSNLLNGLDNTNPYNDTFYNSCMANKARLEENMEATANDDLLNSDIEIIEIKRLISKLKNKKACGIDQIPNEVLKCSGVHGFLKALFQKCFISGKVPLLWQKSIIKPIPKGADKNPFVPLNYRGISLISCVSKTYSALLNSRIVNFCNTRGIFPDEQNGFRAGRSCEDHIFSLSAIIRNRMNNKKSTFCAFIDLEKAFDWVNRNLLLLRLLENKITGKIYFAVQSILSNTKSCIQLNDLHTNWFENSCGVRQGDSLSPTLFSLYINDLAKTLKDSGPQISIGNILINILLYADDMVLIAESEESLQKLLDITHEWCMKWRLSLNRDKTQIVHFRHSRMGRTSYQFKYGTEEIKVVPSYKYLGVILDEFLNFKECARVLATAGGRALGGIISKFKTMKNVGYHTFTKLFNTGVNPILEYGSGIWGFIKADEISQIQHRAMRYFLGVNKFCPLAGLHGDMGWVNQTLKRYKPMARLWNRLLLMGNDRLTKQIFLWDYTQPHGWSSEIKKVYTEMGLGQNFEEKQFIDLRIVDNKIVEIMGNDWKEQVNNKPKLRTYKLFKKEFKPSNSVFINNRVKRSLISKFRMGILPIAIETGRWRGMELQNRVCEICGNGDIEDEMHFLLKCAVYDDLRLDVFEKCKTKNDMFLQLNDTEKLLEIVNRNERVLSEFLLSSWNRRRSLLYS